MAVPLAAPPPKQRRSRISRRVGIPLLILAVILAFVVVRYGSVLLTALDAKSGAEQLSNDIHAMTPADLNHDRLTQLHGEIDRLHNDVGSLRDFLGSDPLVGLARKMGSTSEVLTDADTLMAAASDLADAGQTAIGLGDKFVALREGGADQSLLAGVVKLMATSTTDVDHIGELFADAQQKLGTIPPDANGQIRHLADLMSAPLDKYSPLLDQYRGIDGILPPVLGWGGPKRYLVLAMDPAELRPNGGYTGTVGLVTFDNGSLAQKSFTDVYNYDLLPNAPFVDPPIELQNHLLQANPQSNGSWQLADAAWSPDYPTSAENALRLYSNETKDTNIDGVIALTTFAVDRLMEVTGPITVGDGYNVTVKPGEVTMVSLDQTRGISTQGSNRKAFLNSLAETLLQKLFTLPPSKWVDLYDAFQDIGNQRLMQVWLKDPQAESLVADSALGGALDGGAGDYLYVVEANVAPPSKYNLVVKRTDDLSVSLNPDGSADETLHMSWLNDAMKQGEPYASIREYSTSHGGLYGTYVRAVTKATTQFVSASGEAADPITDPETNDVEVNHNVVGNYLLILPGDPNTPGTADLTYQWKAPSAAIPGAGSWTYRLTIQRQPAIGPQSVTVHVTLPPGATIASVSDGATTAGNVVTYTTPLSQDEQLQIRYSLP